MTRQGVILYGPPTSGKDTITRTLVRLDGRFQYFPRLKTGGGRTDGYRMILAEEAVALRRHGTVLYENARYGNRYVIDRPGLDAMFRSAAVPIVHVGQVAGVIAVRGYPADWLAVLLWCSREVARERAAARGTDDVDARLGAWDETALDIERNGTADFALRIDTGSIRPGEAAELIRERLCSEHGR